ncbi:TetR/AcrR family transcriptional regulator [Saccharomonospora iraqiensis]|uniref:TetR/AcrR family transcriptional regulator n=1 Tax=Saccharomonospora iraqiensis TaxID=52698 RepID=UPI00040E0930|nr:TetR/AcrR family transcriptional regulator [Saccharomonospora iraqiensis]
MEQSSEIHWTPGARRIMDVASELFYRNSIQAVGVDTIAAESGVTKRTLYDRFGSKDALVANYLRRRHEVWWERLEERLAASPPPRALAFFDAYATDAAAVDRGCAFLNAAAELPTDHPGFEVIRAHKRAIRERLRSLIDAELPGIDDQHALAETLFLLLEGGIAQRGIDGDERLLTRARDHARDLLLPTP